MGLRTEIQYSVERTIIGDSPLFSHRVQLSPIFYVISCNEKEVSLLGGLKQWSYDIDSPHIERSWIGY